MTEHADSEHRRIDEPQIEPERYELSEGPRYTFTLDRRRFFASLGAGVLVVLLAERDEAQESGRDRRQRGEAMPQEIEAWLHLGADGTVTVFTGKAEMGQNVRTSLAQAVAGELDVPVSSLRMVLGDTDLTPFDMGTFGSRSTPYMAPQLRRMAATARQALLELAAAKWGVAASGLRTANGKVSDASNARSVSYGELAEGRQLVRATVAEPGAKRDGHSPGSGQNVPKLDGRDMVTGRHRFSADIKRPGMLYGAVLRPPSFGATPASLDTREAEQIAGVTVVRDANFVGACAPTREAAAQAVKAIRATWNEDAQPANAELFELLKKQSSAGTPRRTGSIDEGLRAAAHKLDRTYTVAYIAHAPLEPRAAVAEWTDGKLTVWTGSQRPFGVRGELAEAFRMPEERVRVIIPDTGSGYGGKHTGDAAIEAARLAKAAGKPVSLLWTREEEFSWAYFRPAGVIEIRSGATADGKLTAWEFHNYNSGGAGIQTMYDVPNQHIEFHSARSPLRQGSYRGLAATANHFARESHMDELAAELRLDPLEFRLKNLKDERLRAVFQAAAERFGWGKAPPSRDRGFGIAGGFEKGGYAAACAEVRIEPGGQVRVVRIVSVFDCGEAVNPVHLHNQIEGAAVQGLGGALFEAVQFSNGRILNNRFSLYRVPRFADTPALETAIVDGGHPSAGAGETPIVGIAPAIAGAIFQATGVRLRSLPLIPDGVVKS